MAARPFILSASLILATIAAGLALRLTHVGLPFLVVKYGGSLLWAAMIYWIASTLCPRSPLVRTAILSAGIASTVEFFKLVHSPGLDAFRLTLPGILLLGRVFSPWDFAAYAVGIIAAASADRRLRPAR